MDFLESCPNTHKYTGCYFWKSASFGGTFGDVLLYNIESRFKENLNMSKKCLNMYAKFWYGFESTHPKEEIHSVFSC